jgi:hypothetical protein
MSILLRLSVGAGVAQTRKVNYDPLILQAVAPSVDGESATESVDDEQTDERREAGVV